VRALLARHPGLNVELIRTSVADQTDVIHDGRADVSYVRLPIDRRGLRVRELTAEPRVVVLPAEHRLAGKDCVEIADLAGEHLLQDPDLVPEWRDIADEVSAGRRRAEPAMHSVEEKLERVAAGRGVVVFPLSTATYYTRRDIVHVAVRDIGPSQVCLAWDSTRRSPLIAEFAAIVEESVR
jgi:DNA-binding transcriptional LysR family regulator